jgi:hypothetical protein
MELGMDKSIMHMPDKSLIPRLGHNLERVVQHSGVHTFKWKGKNQFHPFLDRIIQPSQFQIKNSFKKPSADPLIKQVHASQRVRYVSSTSSISSALSQIYLGISNHNPTYSKEMRTFQNATNSYANSVKKPSAIIVSPYQNVDAYSIDSFQFEGKETILSTLGMTLERMLCMTADEFYSRQWAKEQYIISKFGDFMIRAQLDCYSPTIDGYVDIKTRAISHIRHDVTNYNLHTRTHLETIMGQENSFEKEFYDMVRSVFIKYSLQARLGQMSGMFVAYHNTLHFQGFEYLTLQEIENYVFGNSTIASQCFDWEIMLLKQVLDKVTGDFPKRKLKVSIAAGKEHRTQVWVEVLEDNQPHELIGKEVHLYALKTIVLKNGDPLTTFHFAESDTRRLMWSFEYQKLVGAGSRDWEQYSIVTARNLYNNKHHPI